MFHDDIEVQHPVQHVWPRFTIEMHNISETDSAGNITAILKLWLRL